jgi:signal recognition particle receptor subunit beta
MPRVDPDRRTIAFKLVYCGPGMSGKTTNLVHVHRSLAEKHRGDLVQLDTEEERTLFFDFFPLELGSIDGFGIRFNMYTVPGQTFYEASRRLILDGADGAVFVADSSPARLEENVQSFASMQENLRSYDVDPRKFPIVLQYNKRDLERAIPVGTLERALGLDVPVFQAVARKGEGVLETVREVSRRVVQRFLA